MTILTVQRYLELTHDTDSVPSAIEAALADAQIEIEDELGRALESDERTETLFVSSNGRAYPSVTPVTDAGDYEVINNGVVVSDFFSPALDFITGQPSQVEITYTGGYTAETIPYRLERALADAAYDQLHSTSTSEFPAGATSVRLGDAAVTFAEPVGSVRSSTSPTIKRYARRRV